MKTIPQDIRALMTDYTKTNTRTKYLDKEFALVIDPRHTNTSDHYCAWSLLGHRDLLSLTQADIPFLERVKRIAFIALNISDETHLVFIHFPPSWWSLHIHFVSKNHNLLCPKEHAFYLNDIIHNLGHDSDFYRKRVAIS